MLPKIIIISSFKPLLPEFIVEQTNSLRSWKQLRCQPTIVIVGNDKGVKELCEKENVIHHEYVEKNKYGTPLVNSIIEEGWKYADDKDIIIFINGDIILNDQICDTLEAFVKNYPDYYEKNYLLTAIRYNWRNFYEINFNEKNWYSQLLNNNKFEKEHPNGIDIFIHRKNTIKNMPESGIGKFSYDGWLLINALVNFDICINITDTCKIIHHYGKWYQGNKVCQRKTMTREIQENVAKFRNPLESLKQKAHKLALITNCPLKTCYKDNEIVIKNVN